jgi:hypothetical protein
MTTTTASSSSGSNASTQRSGSTREGAGHRRPAREATPQEAEAFAKLLRQKNSDPDTDASGSGAVGLFHAPRPGLPPPLAAPQDQAGVPAIAPTATADALRCAQVHGAAPAAALAGITEAPSSWEVRLGDPLAGDLQLRATTSGTTAAALAPAAPTWELSLASSQIGAQTLARHAPRLSERLRERGLDHSSVQVPGSRERRTPQDDKGDELA